MHRELKSLPIAVRVYPQPKDVQAKTRSRKAWQCPGAMLVFDTETRTAATQSMTFGSYRFILAGRCLEEGLFYDDDLLHIPDEADQRSGVMSITIPG